MIIFYDKLTGQIMGSINGRTHHEEELNMWVGKETDTDRIFCMPDNPMFFEIEKDPQFKEKFKVDVEAKTLIPIIQ